MTDFAIETHQLCKSFKDQPALRGLDLHVPAGSIFGLLGLNGKQDDHDQDTHGSIASRYRKRPRVWRACDGRRRAAGVRRLIGFVTEDKELYPYMTVEQIIRFTRPFLPN